MTEIELAFARHGITAESITKQETWKVQQAWRETFAARLKRSTGKWSLGNIDWHVFSYEIAPCCEGHSAIQAYSELTEEACYFIVSTPHVIGYKCIGRSMFNISTIGELQSELPFSEGLRDLYISALDFRWTMVFTHELDFGPYFALASEQ